MRFAFFIVLFLVRGAFAGSSGVAISGQIVDVSGGSFLSAPSVDFFVSVLSPSGCILYSESHLGQDLSASAGHFNLVLGAGASPSNVYEPVNPQSESALQKIFDNSVGSVSSLTGADASECVSGTYSPSAGEIRQIRIAFDAKDGDGLQVITPYYSVRNVPRALLARQAEDSKLFGGKLPSDYLEVGQLAAAETDPTVRSFAKNVLPTCAADQVLKADGASLICVSDQTGPGTFSGDVSGTSSTLSVDKIKSKSIVPGPYTAGQHLRFDGANWVNDLVDLSLDISGQLSVSNGGTGVSTIGSGNLMVGAGKNAITSLAAGTAGNVVYASGISTWSSGSPDVAGLVDKNSTQVISGAKAFTNYLQMSGQNEIRFADSDSTNFVALRAPATVAIDSIWTLPATAGGPGQVLTTNGSGILSWSTVSSGLPSGGSSGAPAYAFSSDSDTGIFSDTANTLSISTGGAERVRIDASGNLTTTGRMVSGITAGQNSGDSPAVITVNFSSVNTVRDEATGACAELDFSNTAAGGYFTVTLPNITTSCATFKKNGNATNVKISSGYAPGEVNGVVYTAIDDGVTLWVSVVPF